MSHASLHTHPSPLNAHSAISPCRHQLSSSLSALSIASSTLPTSLPPEIIEYIDQGRNPEIYNRELVEALQKSNQFLKGKSEAFAGFRDMLAEEIIKVKPEAEDEVKGVLEGNEAVDVPQSNGVATGEPIGH